ncbi:peroxidase-like [Anopheles darlingi]|uniref:peroxidase-like n=1 Tax=Anopheles darlingi TaxID=43151 RepID=UPI0021000D32|nr:peroxidase-like [Anopheles darlingi]
MWMFLKLLLLVCYSWSCAQATNCNTTSPYRTLDGSCNNLQNPSWGAANTVYERLIAADYGDGVKSPRKATNGADLPSARTISMKLFGDENVLEPAFTLLSMQFGQLVAHDMGFIRGGADILPCCSGGKLVSNPVPRCYPIPVASDDPVMGSAGVQCLDFLRTITDCDTDSSSCSNNKKAEQLNVVTSFLDLSVVYGNSVEENTPLRQFTGGLMKVETRDGTDWPPQNPNANTVCVQRNPDDACYLTGDARANLSPHLAILHILFLREHNRIATRLAALHPDWNDEKLFQEARRINIAQYQQIVFYEWLPNFLPLPENGDKRSLVSVLAHQYRGDVNPTTLNSNAHAAFRYFHSAIISQLHLDHENRSKAGEVSFTDHTLNPAILEAPCKYAQLSRGLATQPMGRIDLNIDHAIKHNFLKLDAPFGNDLRAIDIQRARDHGLPSYNRFREWCGLSKAASFDELASLLHSSQDAARLAAVYASVDDVELTVAGLFEKHVPGTQVGATFRCILLEQFHRTRVGDRFFFETSDPIVGFSKEQFKQLRKANIARLLCDNTPKLEGMQSKAFATIDAGSNKVSPCSSLPVVDLDSWK